MVFKSGDACLKQVFSFHIRQGGEDGFQNSFLSFFRLPDLVWNVSNVLSGRFALWFFGGFVVFHDNRKNRIAGKAD